MGVTRQLVALDGLLRRAERIPAVDAVILIRLRVAEPARVVLGDPAVLGRTRRRPPIMRAEMTGSEHPIEAAYDQLKEAIRRASRPPAT